MIAETVIERGGKVWIALIDEASTFYAPREAEWISNTSARIEIVRFDGSIWAIESGRVFSDRELAERYCERWNLFVRKLRDAESNGPMADSRTAPSPIRQRSRSPRH